MLKKTSWDDKHEIFFFQLAGFWTIVVVWKGGRVVLAVRHLFLKLPLPPVISTVVNGSFSFAGNYDLIWENSISLADTYCKGDFNTSASGLKPCWWEMRSRVKVSFHLPRVACGNTGKALCLFRIYLHGKLSKPETIINCAFSVYKTLL